MDIGYIPELTVKGKSELIEYASFSDEIGLLTAHRVD